MICPNCGAQNRDDAKFCKSCGTPQTAHARLHQQPGNLGECPPVETKSPMVIGLEAVFLSGLRKGESVKLTTFPATIGRDPNSTLPLALQDQLASTRHAQILHEGSLCPPGCRQQQWDVPQWAAGDGSQTSGYGCD